MYFVQSVMLTLFLTIIIRSAPLDFAPFCTETEFDICTNDQCIRNMKRICNTNKDCNKDMEMCRKFRNINNFTEATTDSKKTMGVVNLRSVLCKANEFECASGQECILNETTCDGYNDCSDGSDEVPKWCKTRLCQEEEFKCTSGQCIHGDSICDGYIDCVDAIDEDETLCNI